MLRALLSTSLEKGGGQSTVEPGRYLLHAGIRTNNLPAASSRRRTLGLSSRSAGSGIATVASDRANRRPRGRRGAGGLPDVADRVHAAGGVMEPVGRLHPDRVRGTAADRSGLQGGD